MEVVLSSWIGSFFKKKLIWKFIKSEFFFKKNKEEENEDDDDDDDEVC